MVADLRGRDRPFTAVARFPGKRSTKLVSPQAELNLQVQLSLQVELNLEVQLKVEVKLQVEAERQVQVQVPTARSASQIRLCRFANGRPDAKC